jgi:tRNA C32,U32 (ribose-2'-O)-methylase TrmJ
MAARRDIVIERIRSLLAALNNGKSEPSRERIESTLTEGYAEALALDGERLRLERKIDDVTAHLASGSRSRLHELQRVMARLEIAEHDLAELRELLASLRNRSARAA